MKDLDAEHVRVLHEIANPDLVTYERRNAHDVYEIACALERRGLIVRRSVEINGRRATQFDVTPLGAVADRLYQMYGRLG